MTTWKPIELEKLFDKIQQSELSLNGDLWNFWELIKIYPEKWIEPKYSNEGHSFWVVAICGRKVIWYNDLEEGFNISNYNEYGLFEGYYCNQSTINEAVVRLYDLIKFGGDIIGQAGPHSNLN